MRLSPLKCCLGSQVRLAREVTAWWLLLNHFSNIEPPSGNHIIAQPVMLCATSAGILTFEPARIPAGLWISSDFFMNQQHICYENLAAESPVGVCFAESSRNPTAAVLSNWLCPIWPNWENSARRPFSIYILYIDLAKRSSRHQEGAISVAI